MAALVALTWWYGASLAQLPNFSGDGVAVSLVILVSTPVQVGAVGADGGGRPASPPRIISALCCRGKATSSFGVIAVIAFIAFGDAISFLLGQNVVTPFQRDIYRTADAAGWLPVLWLVVVVVTPIGEETLFRGFLFRGWLARRAMPGR